MQEQRNEQHLKTENEIGRRGFLVAGIYGLLSVIAGSFGITSALYLFRGSKQKQGTAWADAGDISALTSGIPQKITFERTRTDGWRISNQKDSAWVIRNTDDKVIAFSPLCTHLGCAYRWKSNAEPSKHGTFVCPCHGSTFSQTGDVITGPANRPLDRYATRREGTRLWLGPISPAQNLKA
jgi:menaquinol-cytochrome c reductase iron-sulfur subunit